MDATSSQAAVNEVRLLGRVSAVLDERVLPSGHVVVPMRVVVPRSAGGAPSAAASSRALVDVIDVACWSGETRAAAAELAPGDTVAVEGTLRRRFFRAGVAVQSRYEVQAERLRRLPGPLGEPP